METKRSNLRFTITVSLALAGITGAGAVLLYRAEPARAQEQSEGQFEPTFEQIPVPDVIPEPPQPPPQPPEGFDFGPGEDLERPDPNDVAPTSAPATGPTSAPAPVVEEPEPVRPAGPPPRGTRVRRGSTRGPANDN